MITIDATSHYEFAPTWAIVERKLIDLMDEAVYPYAEKYTNADGELIWKDEWSDSRDGADDFYEAFHNFAQFYALGGGDHLLEMADRHWDAITRQMTRYGRVYKEYERGYDQFHQSESYIYFHFLCLADPKNSKLLERARRFAGFYLNEDPEARNYDPKHKIIRAPHNGSGGPAWGMSEDDSNASYTWSPGGMAVYGLPLTDVPGIEEYDDLKDPENARRMGQAMASRFRQGDVGNNLHVNGLIMNAYLMTGDQKYRDWLLEYVGVWLERARANGGIMPDNVGLNGEVGADHNGKWYGGLYGWTWPHGFYNLGFAAVTAANNAYLLTGDEQYFELPRKMIDAVLEQGIEADYDKWKEKMSIQGNYIGVDRALGPDRKTFLVPFRYGDKGWFDYQPMHPTYALNLWYVSGAAQDWQRVEFLRSNSGYDWNRLVPFRDKGDMNHDEPWILYLLGENPEYPEQMLAATYAQVSHRLAQVRADEEDLGALRNYHHWQQIQPVITEVLMQLTVGAPQVIYYGGMFNASLRYFDAERKRPGLPRDVAALVEKVEPERTVVNLVNISPFASREVIVQAGGLGEHRFLTATYDAATSSYPAPGGAYAPQPLTTEQQTVEIGDRHIRVCLPPATQIRLDLAMKRNAHTPSYAVPSVISA